MFSISVTNGVAVPQHPQTLSGINRRRFLENAAVAAVSGIAVPSLPTWGWSERRELGPPLPPDGALEALLAGNRRFVANQLISRQQDLSALRHRTAEKQEPFAAVLACADSRVPVELLFDQSIGQIFVTRVAGNIVTPELIASLEYAVAVLGVRTVLVLGHTHCGAVKAAMKTDTVPGQISTLYQHIRPAVPLSGGDVEKAIVANARSQADLLRTSSTVIRDTTAHGAISVSAAVYDLATGQVALI